MIKDKDFKKICQISEKLLKSDPNNLILASVDQLHIIRPHPIFLRKYEILKENFFYIKILSIFFKNIIKILTIFLINIFKKKIKNNYKKKDFIFVSHFLNEIQIKNKKENDYYFSHVIKNIKSKSTLVLFNHLKKNYYSRDKFILNLNTSLFYEIKIIKELVQQLFRFNTKCLNKDKSKFAKKFLLFIYTNILSVDTLNNVRIYYQFLNIIKKVRPKKIIVTFEGHAFERNIFLATKKINSKIETIGFHHSIPFKNQFAYTLNLKNNSNPDIIFASGKSSFKKFSSNKNFKKTILVGSNRISKLKFDIDNKFNESKLTNLKYCLVIPEGIEGEVDLLLNFCNDYLLKFNNINFIVRLHPVLRNKIKKFQSLFDTKYINKKVFFSNNKNQYYDIKKCDIALYRGTSLIFDSVKNGLVPFYYSRKNEIDFDPLSISENKYNQSIKILDIYQLNKVIKNNNIFKKNYYFEAYSYPDQKRIVKYFK